MVHGSEPRKRVDVTVAIASADRPEALGRCLDAVLAGTAQPREILVVDQSRDGRSREVVRARATQQDQVRVIEQERLGLSAARNEALSAARSSVVAVTDDDCVPSPGWLSAFTRAFEQPSSPVAVTGPMLPMGDESDGYAVSSRTSRQAAEYTGNRLPWLIGTGANVAVRRELALSLGGYDERLGVGSPGGAGEDIDFLHRLLRTGGLVRYEPEALVYHERQPKSRRRASRSTYGHGIGACCGLWLRERDVRALTILGHWCTLRGGRLARAARQRNWDRVTEELLVLGGTARGFVYGVRLGR